jgi:CheY-like chemotaxis protein
LAGLHVLLAEDGADNQRLISSMLRHAGATVTLASNGSEALEKVVAASYGQRASDPRPIDLVLMDMQMPVLDGYQAARDIRSKGIALPIIALTAHVMSGDRERCLGAGCTSYLIKPVQRGELLRAVARYAKSTLVPPSVSGAAPLSAAGEATPAAGGSDGRRCAAPPPVQHT